MIRREEEEPDVAEAAALKHAVVSTGQGAGWDL